MREEKRRDRGKRVEVAESGESKRFKSQERSGVSVRFPHPSVKCERTCFKWFQAAEESFVTESMIPKTSSFCLSLYREVVSCLRLYTIRLIKYFKRLMSSIRYFLLYLPLSYSSFFLSSVS